MSSSVTLTAAVRSNLLALQDTTSLQATTQQRLATGKKVNSALDNPTNFFTAAALSERAGQLNNLPHIQAIQARVPQARQDASWQSSSYTLDSTTVGTSSAKNITFSGGAVTG